MVALAIMPLLFGNAFHYLVPDAHGFLHSSEHLPCCSHEEKSENNSLPTPEDACLVCDFLAMPLDVARLVAWNCVLDLVEHHESEPVQVFVVLYRPFEPGRAPPTVV